MTKCTAPLHGHRNASGRAMCPACGQVGIDLNAYSGPPWSSGSASGAEQEKACQIPGELPKVFKT